MENVNEDTVKLSTRTMSIPKDILEGLCSRFLINIPVEEKEDMIRLCFQIQLAHWFYLDFYRQEDPQLPGCGLQQFMEIIFNEFTFLNKEGAYFEEIFRNWRKYQQEVPVYGAIMLDEMLENCILVRGYLKRVSWGFPKGKVNKDEEGKDCAIREVFEETGYEIENLIDEKEYLECNFHDHMVRLYIVPFVQSSFTFEPKTRGEIQEIKWFPIDGLPSHKKDTTSRDRLGLNASSFFMVQPFVKNLRKWVNHKKQSIQNLAMLQVPNETHIRHSQYSAFTLVENTKEDEERLLKRKQEEERRFQEIQLSSNPLLSISDNDEQLRNFSGIYSQRKKSKRKNDKEKNCDRQPEAIRKLLTGTVTQVDNTKQQTIRGFGLPPEYEVKKKQPGTSIFRDWAVGEENYSHDKRGFAHPLDESEIDTHWKYGLVKEQGLMEQSDRVPRSHTSENGMKSYVSENPPSRGWYGSAGIVLNEKEDAQIKRSKDSPVMYSGRLKGKDEDVHSKRMKGKKGLPSFDETFQFQVPEFLNFKFDIEALIETLPPETIPR